MTEFAKQAIINPPLLVYGALVALCLLLSCLLSRDRKTPFMRRFAMLMVAAIITLLGEAMLWTFYGNPERIPLLRMGMLGTFAGGYVMMAMYSFCLMSFVRIRKPDASFVWAYVCGTIAVILIVLTSVEPFCSWVYTIQPDGVVRYNPGYDIVNLLDGVVLLVQCLLVLGFRRSLGKKNTIVLLSFSATIMAGVLLQANWDTVPMYLAEILTFLALHVLFQREQGRRLAEKEAELAASRVDIMISQIQPHFLYNTLTSIYQLCAVDPEAAQETIGKFARYLRSNMDFVNRQERIPFFEELRHINTYLEIEQIRFGERLQVRMDIQADRFYLPPLTIQPLVENAVKHGIGGKKAGGTVSVASWETEEAYVVSVSDTGAGFSENPEEAEQRRIGLQNVRDRLAALSDGRLEILSTPGEGATVRVILPRKKAEKLRRKRP